MYYKEYHIPDYSVAYTVSQWEGLTSVYIYSFL